MAQTSLIISTLKKTLKSHGKTYADVAKHLELSEASIKRMFAQQTFSLNRLDAICQMMEMEITELIQQVNDSTARQIDELSDDQEKQLASDLELLLDESSGVLHVRSASRIGKSDLGANRKRIEALRELEKSS